MKYLIDSYAWIEYLNGSTKGEKVRDILLKENEVYTLSLNVAEVVSRVARENGDANVAFSAMESNSKIINISSEEAKEGGIFHAKQREKVKDFGLVDSLLFVVSKKIGAVLVTGDKHFKDFKGVLFLS